MIKPTDKTRIAMIGLGDIATKAYLPVIANHSEISPILCTRNSERLAELAQQYRIDERYSTLDELLLAQPDAVMIHSATDSHFAIAKRCIEAGIATFIDKPISTDFTECQQLLALAQERQAIVYLGFNRRFAPLIKLLNNASLNHVRWQKNRVAPLATPREFIFNDFIHVIDGLRYLAGSPDSINEDSLTVRSHFVDDLLAHIHIQFQVGNCLFEGSMNRISGVTEERVEAFAINEKWQIDNVNQGRHYQKNQMQEYLPNDWQSYLVSRGFSDMVADWLSVVQGKTTSEQRLNDIFASHQLCQAIIERITKHNKLNSND